MLPIVSSVSIYPADTTYPLERVTGSMWYLMAAACGTAIHIVSITLTNAKVRGMGISVSVVILVLLLEN
jgi:hypothetical protein